MSGDGGLFLYELWSGHGVPYGCGLWTEAAGAAELPNSGGFDGVSAEALAPDGKWTAIDWNLCTTCSETVLFVWSVDAALWYSLAPADDWRGTVSAIAGSGIAAAMIYSPGTMSSRQYARWTPDGGAQELPIPPGISVTLTQRFAITSDGSAIVAAPIGAFGKLIFWINSGQDYVVADSATLDYEVSPIHTSDDLKIVIGTKAEGPGLAFPGLWTPRRGTRRIADVLAAYGVDITGWTLRYVFDITPDGRVIVGYGTNPEGDTEGFRIVGRLYCSPDCNDDGRLNINDFICFQAKWKAKDFYADYKLDGTFNINDFIAFQTDWRKGCE